MNENLSNNKLNSLTELLKNCEAKMLSEGYCNWYRFSKLYKYFYLYVEDKIIRKN